MHTETFLVVGVQSFVSNPEPLDPSLDPKPLLNPKRLGFRASGLGLRATLYGSKDSCAKVPGLKALSCHFWP